MELSYQKGQRKSPQDSRVVRKGHRLARVVIALSSYQVDELHILIVGRHDHRGNMSGLASLGVPLKKETENLMAVNIPRGEYRIFSAFAAPSRLG